MTELTKFWIKSMYEREIKETKKAISNEHLWELGCEDASFNPHSENIREMTEYIELLEEKIEELE